MDLFYLKSEIKKLYKTAHFNQSNISKEFLLLKWVHRFGYASLSELEDITKHQPEEFKQIDICNFDFNPKLHSVEEIAFNDKCSLADRSNEIEDQDKCSLADRSDEIEDQDKCSLADKSDKIKNNSTNQYFELSKGKKGFESAISDEKFNYLINKKELPLPSINHLRKWISNNVKEDREAS